MLCRIGFLLSLVMGLCFVQGATSAHFIKQTRGVSIKNSDGWEIPFLKQVREPRRTTFSFPGTPPIPVQETIFLPPSTPNKDLPVHRFPLYSVDGNTIKIAYREFAVERIIEFSSLDNRVFCYSFHCRIIIGLLEGTDFMELGPHFSVFYFDMDKDGTFETLEYGRALSYERIPKWVFPVETKPEKEKSHLEN